MGQLLVKRLLKITVTGGSVRSEMPGQLPLKQGGQFVVKQVGQLGVKYSCNFILFPNIQFDNNAGKEDIVL